ncbi:hypothetical protein HYV50_01915 [Candidatus Pacearchaeota archaeon]|nr:hypothetical protein [Candidatus Pacearchaeota archaeon]
MTIALELLKEKGIKKPISLEQLAEARIKSGAKSSLSTEGSYVKEGAIYVPNQAPLFVRDSPVLSNAKEATQAHRENREFYLDAKTYLEQAEEDKTKEPQKRKILILKQRDDFSVPTDKFGENETALWAFRDNAEKYGEFLRENGINNWNVCLVGEYYVDKQEKSFARQLWLRRLDGGSGLSDDYGLLDCDDPVCGVCAEGASEKIFSPSKTSKDSSPYTQKELEKYTKIVEGVRKGNLPSSKLEKIEEFLEKLKN